MNKPEVILNIFSSIDGKITTAPGKNVAEWTAAGIDGEANEITHQLYDDLDCDGLVSGSESLIVWGKDWVELDKPIYVPQKSKAYIVFDGKGRLNWYQTEGLLVVTKENVSSTYIQQLKEKGINYILAGKGEYIDLPLALHKLYEVGFRKLGLSGGGSINGAFLRKGLIDEISLVIAPLAIGGTSTPSIFDSENLKDIGDATNLELKNMKPVSDGAVWLQYTVIK
ncbi:RibD family protein [Bacillus haikouensis]|uniref:RibD family protein n=1 Tax=Bacillus haikouensis TaxID=1510468 RepID=UPI001555027D|nr:RibD family protein [Bacillus haikouensis]NQD67044.1 RibD family protein [Bacillus haikouensis]